MKDKIIKKIIKKSNYTKKIDKIKIYNIFEKLKKRKQFKK